MKTTIAAMVSSLLLATFPTHAADSAASLLQQGIRAQETEGSLETAIRIYENIVKESEANRSLAAQAQYRLGECHLKQGRTAEAEAAFRAIAERFPGETELLAKSRHQLKQMGKATGPMIVRKVWSDAEDTSGGISADGRYLSFVDWNTGDLALRDLSNNQNRRLTDKGPWEKSSQFAEASVFSPDHKQLAYSWFDGKEKYELRVMSLDDSKPRVLMTAPWLWPTDWTQDGKAVAVVVAKERREYDIAMISPSGDSKRTVKSLAGRDPNEMCFSPDGRYLAYSLRAENKWESDIFLLDLNEGSETELVEHPADDKVLAWTPDGSALLFSSDRRGSTDLWSLPMASGHATGRPVLLRASVGDISSIGFSDGGAFYYGLLSNSTEFYVATLDFSTSKLDGTPKELPNRSGGFRNQFSLSADGRFLAFVQRRGSHRSFKIQDFQTGEEREYRSFPDLRSNIPSIWSDDSRHLVFRGFTQDNRNNLFVLNRLTDQTTAVSVPEPNSGILYWGMELREDALRYLQWDGKQKKLSRIDKALTTGEKREHAVAELSEIDAGNRFILSSDNKQLFYIRRARQESGPTNWVAIRRDVTTGKELELLRSTNVVGFVGEPATDSPIALVLTASARPRMPRAITVIDVGEASAKERFSVELPERAALAPGGWIGSKPHLLFTKRVADGAEASNELWTLSAENGEMKKTDLARSQMSVVATRGANQVFFQQRGPALSEVWAMENFLPQLAAKK